jgi:hypothetical protein
LGLSVQRLIDGRQRLYELLARLGGEGVVAGNGGKQVACVGADGRDGPCDRLETRRGEGDFHSRAGIDHSLGDKKSERVGVGHHPVVPFRGLLDDLAADAFVKCMHPGRRGTVAVPVGGGTDHDPKGPLRECQAGGAEEGVSRTPGDGAPQHLGQRSGRMDLHAADVENHLSGVEVGQEVEKRGAHLGYRNRQDHEFGPAYRTLNRLGAMFRRDLGDWIVCAMGDSGLRQEPTQCTAEPAVSYYRRIGDNVGGPALHGPTVATTAPVRTRLKRVLMTSWPVPKRPLPRPISRLGDCARSA